MVKEKKEIAWGMPFLPLLIFLVLVIILLLVLPLGFLTQTGQVISGIDLTKDKYNPNEKLQGDANIELRWGDLIPAVTNVEFTIDSNDTTISNIVLQLPMAIALSKTPTYGNFTYGAFRNMNGPIVSGDGYGFAACVIRPSPKQATTYAVSAPSPILPDLTVTSIYQASGGTGGITPVERLYAKIANIGTRSTLDPSAPSPGGGFIVKGCWYEPSGISPSCFFEQEVGELDVGDEITLDMGSRAVEGKSVQVIVDYYGVIVESNEYNNELIKSFGGSQTSCSDPDGLDYFTKGVCSDSSPLLMIKEDYCSEDDNTTLFEWTCPNPSGLCATVEYTCLAGCQNGACMAQGPSETCTDTDGGKNYYKKGTCSDLDMLPVVHDDGCLEVGGPGDPNIAEWYCTGNNLIMWDSKCSECSAAYCNYKGTKSEGWYTNCNSGGEKLIRYELCDGRHKFAPVCLYPETKGEGWYTSDVCDKEESYCNYGCSAAACKTNPYECDDWNNIYTINLSKLILKAPQERGSYTFTVALTQEGPLPEKTILYSSSETFETTSHRACQNYQCVWVAGTGNDQCTTNEQCKQTGGGGGGGGGGGACNENWMYGSWSTCISGQRTRECYDARYCGTTYAKPISCLSSGTKFIQTESCIPGCQENWQCADWSYCSQETQEQTTVCEEMSRCNPMNYSYVQIRECCIEDWSCSWGTCKDGFQDKVCKDNNNCGSEFTKPTAEQRVCKARAWGLYAIIAVAAILAVLAVLYATKVIKLPIKGAKVGKSAEEEAHFTEVKV